VRLDEGYGVDEFMNTLMSVFGGSPEFPEWFQWYGGVTASPGNTLAYTIDLIPGNYVIFSVSGAESGEPDLARGMLSTLTVGEAADNEATPPAADLRALLVDFSFVIEGTPKPGPMIVEVANMGAEPHEIALMQLFDGAGLSDVMDFMMAGEDAEGAPPFMPAGGVAPMNAGLTGWYEADMPAGNYAIICFIPSVANEGMPHFMLGMAQEVSVEEASQ
jgi:hypothetical protein